jgi:hypothetical protein
MRAGCWFAVVGVLVGAGAGAGCENTPPKIADAIPPERVDAGGGAMGSPDAASVDPDPPDAAPFVNADTQALLACDVEEPCSKAEVQLIEAQTHNVPAERVTCVLNALAARTPGRYRYSTGSVYTNGGYDVEHTLLITAEGTVIHSSDVSVSSYDAVRMRSVFQQYAGPSQRCTLQPSSYFEGCVAEVAKQLSESEDAAAWACAFGDGDGFTPNELRWFDACEAQSPAGCE